MPFEPRLFHADEPPPPPEGAAEAARFSSESGGAADHGKSRSTARLENDPMPVSAANIDSPPGANEIDLELPDDLGLLAAQLGEDADRLAACYPALAAHRALPGAAPLPVEAGVAADLHVPAHGVWAAWLKAGIAAAALLIVATGGLLAWRHGNQPDRQVGLQAPTATRQATASADPQLGGAAIVRRGGDTVAQGFVEPESVGEALPPSHPMPPMVFQELSGPEQEAVLDLMEEQSLAQASLSI